MNVEEFGHTVVGMDNGCILPKGRWQNPQNRGLGNRSWRSRQLVIPHSRRLYFAFGNSRSYWTFRTVAELELNDRLSLIPAARASAVPRGSTPGFNVRQVGWLDRPDLSTKMCGRPPSARRSLRDGRDMHGVSDAHPVTAAVVAATRRLARSHLGRTQGVRLPIIRARVTSI